MAGHICEFVELPPKVLQCECPICLLVLREPYQATCCGKSFCKKCIDRVKDRNGKCPTCKTENFFSYPNKGLEQSLYDFEVYCSHKNKGCEWRGELRELEKHLNSEPPADKSLEGCPFTVISCPLGCAACRTKQLPRKDVLAHVNSGALLTHVLQLVGEMKSLKEQLRTHKRDRLLLQQLAGEKQYLEQRVERLEMSNSELKRQVSELKGQHELSSETSDGIIEVTMTNYSQHKRDNDKWYSHPFYSNTQGYKMCLEVVANGYATARGTHLSVYIHLMQGQFDAELRWPFCGEVEVQLLNQEREDKFYSNIITYSGCTSASILRDGNETAKGHGFRHFILHSDLEQEYVNNDSLRFRIQRVTLK